MAREVPCLGQFSSDFCGETFLNGHNRTKHLTQARPDDRDFFLATKIIR